MWKVEENQFETDNLSSSSVRFKEITTKWLEEYTNEEKEKFVKELFQIFKTKNIDNLLDLKEKKLTDILKLIKESNNIDDNVKDMIKDLIILTIKDYSDSTKRVIQNTIEEGKKIIKSIKE